MNISDKSDKYEITDTFQNFPVTGDVIVNKNGKIFINLVIQEGNLNKLQGNYMEQTNSGPMVTIIGEQELLLTFTSYFVASVTEIINTIKSQINNE